MESTFCVCVSVVLAIVANSQGASVDFVDVRTSMGWIRGVQEPHGDGIVTSFYDVPFAAAPIGKNRLLPPQHLEPWEGVKNCTVKDPTIMCPQQPVRRFGRIESKGKEDCLYMNIFTPKKLNQGDVLADLPVMFWIYGGAYIAGDDDEDGTYDGKNLSVSQNVVVVATNYRLGGLGFMATPAVKDMAGTTGSQGVQDQQKALQITHENVALFGGDKSRIALFGESAGAFSICWHYVSPISRRYFNAAIMQSGTCSSAIFFPSLPRAYTFGEEIAKNVGCNASDLRCLQEVPHNNFFLRAIDWGGNSSRAPPLSVTMPYGPAIDKSELGLMARPIELLQNFPDDPKPLILGSNLDEGTMLSPALYLQVPECLPPINADKMLRICKFFFNETTAQEAVEFYEQFEESYGDRLQTMLRDFFFLCPNVYAAEKIVALNDRKARVWMYQFVMNLGFVWPFTDPAWPDYILLGDYHGIENTLVFDNCFDEPFGPRQTAMAKAIGNYWTGMGRSLDPNGDKSSELFHWSPYELPARKHLFLDIPLREGEKLEYETCEFWRTRKEKFYND